MLKARRFLVRSDKLRRIKLRQQAKLHRRRHDAALGAGSQDIDETDAR